MSSTPSRPQSSVSSVLSVREPSPPSRAVIELEWSDLFKPSNHLGCPSVAPEGETAERVARGVGLPAWDPGRHRSSTSITPIDGSRPTFRSLRRLRRRATDGHPRDIEGSCRAFHRGVGDDIDDLRRSLHRDFQEDNDGRRRALPSRTYDQSSGGTRSDVQQDEMTGASRPPRRHDVIRHPTSSRQRTVAKAPLGRSKVSRM